MQSNFPLDHQAHTSEDDIILSWQVSVLTCAMSSKQLKMYFRASFDFIPVSNSCSSGVYQIKYKLQVAKNRVLVFQCNKNTAT